MTLTRSEISGQTARTSFQDAGSFASSDISDMGQLAAFVYGLSGGQTDDLNAFHQFIETRFGGRPVAVMVRDADCPAGKAMTDRTIEALRGLRNTPMVVVDSGYSPEISQKLLSFGASPELLLYQGGEITHALAGVHSPGTIAEQLQLSGGALGGVSANTPAKAFARVGQHLELSQ